MLIPRVSKSLEQQAERTRKKAEVFTPSWICNKMNNHCDEEWFGRPNVFNTEDGQSWILTEDVKIQKHNFKQLDALPYAKEGTLEQKLDEIYLEG